MQEHTHTDLLIVGTGIAGLFAAHAVDTHGFKCTLVEKGERPGGRLSTHAIGPGRGDSGAQFFSVRTAEFQQWVDRWKGSERVYEWSQGWSDGSLAAAPSGHPRFAARGGMRDLASHLADGLDVRYRSRLTVIAPQGERWLAADERGQLYDAAAVLMALPVPLALQLLRAGQVMLDPGDCTALEAIVYDPCLAGLFWIDGDMRLPEPGAVQHANAPITWIADNRRKGISPEALIVTVHAGAAYSRELWHQPNWQALVALEAALRPYKDWRTNIIESRLDRWPYAAPAVLHPERCLLARGMPPLAFAGDAFGGPRVEGAALSGMAAAAALAERLAHARI